MTGGSIVRVIQMRNKSTTKGYFWRNSVCVYKKYNTEQQHCLHTWVTTGFPLSHHHQCFNGWWRKVNRTKTWTQTIDATLNLRTINISTTNVLILGTSSVRQNQMWTSKRKPGLGLWTLICHWRTHIFINGKNNDNKEPDHMLTNTERLKRHRLISLLSR